MANADTQGASQLNEDKETKKYDYIMEHVNFFSSEISKVVRLSIKRKTLF